LISAFVCSKLQTLAQNMPGLLNQDFKIFGNSHNII